MPNPRLQRYVSGVSGALALLVLLAACEAEWEGAELTLEQPPSPRDTVEAPAEEEAEAPPLPAPPMLYRVEAEEDGSARVSPLALVRDGALRGLPSPTDAESWWGRFDSAFLSAGQELPLLAGGARLGTVVLSGAVEGSSPGCPGAASGELLLPPGRQPPASAFAVSPGAGPGGLPGRPAGSETTGRQRTFAPILAERLLREAGVERHYLAREADLRPAALGDSVPGFAATFLIADSLTSGPPDGRAVSLLVLARPHPSDGYVPEWSLVQRYESAGEKAAYRYVESLPLGGDGRIDVLRRYGDGGSRLTAAWEVDGDRRIRWSAPDPCPEGEGE